MTELLKSGKHTVTALTRNESKISVPESVNVVRVHYSDHQSLVSAFKGQQFLVITLSIAASADAHSNIVKAAEAADVRYVMPNFYGGDILNSGMMEESMNGKMYKQPLRDFEGVRTPWIVLVCGFWYEFSLALQESSFGFDISGRRVTLFDDGRTKINVSTWSQCGRAVAALLSLPEKGTSPCVADWQNKPLYISSFRVSQRDMLDSINSVLGKGDDYGAINYEPTEKRFNRGLEALSNGNRTGFPTAFLRTSFLSKWGW